jgi:hypothetical protein
MTHPVPPDLAEILAEIHPPGGPFGHRQHVHLAYIAVHRYGTDEAARKIGGWLRGMAAYAGAPQKYHETITRAWTEIVGLHVTADPDSEFDAFAERNPQLFNKRLLMRHYTSATLASPHARTGWVPPDLAPLGPTATRRSESGP